MFKSVVRPLLKIQRKSPTNIQCGKVRFQKLSVTFPFVLKGCKVWIMVCRIVVHMGTYLMKNQVPVRALIQNRIFCQIPEIFRKDNSNHIKHRVGVTELVFIIPVCVIKICNNRAVSY